MKNKLDTVDIESQYREKFEKLKHELNSRFKKFLSESIIQNSFESPELRAQLEVYKPIVDTLIKSLKDSGVLNHGRSSDKNTPDDNVMDVVIEQTKTIDSQNLKIEELKMRIKLHEMITNNLAGLNKDIVRDAVNEFMGESDLSDDELLSRLTNFINTRKPSNKKIQFESIDDNVVEDRSVFTDSIRCDVDKVNSILNDSMQQNADRFKPSKKIHIPGLKNRVVDESSTISNAVEGDSELSPADEFMRDFGHL